MKLMPAEFMRASPPASKQGASQPIGPIAFNGAGRESFQAQLRSAVGPEAEMAAKAARPERNERAGNQPAATSKRDASKGAAAGASKDAGRRPEGGMKSAEAKASETGGGDLATDETTPAAEVAIASAAMGEGVTADPKAALAVTAVMPQPVADEAPDALPLPETAMPMSVRTASPASPATAQAAAVVSPQSAQAAAEQPAEGLPADGPSPELANVAAAAEVRESPASQQQRDHELLKQMQPVTPQVYRGASPDEPAVDVNAARVARGLQNAVNQNGGAVTLRLTPNDLGTVRIQMQLQGTSVSAQFFTQSDAANAVLNQQLAHLRSALEGQGLTVDRLQVQTMPSTSSNQTGGGQQQSDGAPQDGRSRGFHGGEHGRQPSPDDRGARRDESGRRGGFMDFLTGEQH